jgi:hypothetical protein
MSIAKPHSYVLSRNRVFFYSVGVLVSMAIFSLRNTEQPKNTTAGTIPELTSDEVALESRSESAPEHLKSKSFVVESSPAVGFSPKEVFEDLQQKTTSEPSFKTPPQKYNDLNAREKGLSTDPIQDYESDYQDAFDSVKRQDPEDYSPPHQKIDQATATPTTKPLNSTSSTALNSPKATNSTLSGGEVYPGPFIPPKKVFIGTDDQLQDLKAYREEHFGKPLSNVTNQNYRTLGAKTNQNLGYELDDFNPGLAFDGVSKIKTPNIIKDAILGPDFVTDMVLDTDPIAMAKIKSKVLSLGHGGSVTLNFKNQPLYDIPGADFSVFENVMNLGKGQYWQEIARVGVSTTTTGENFIWFPCKPDGSIQELEGCAGLTPTDREGDSFDIARLGLSEIRRIRIQDSNQNKHIGKNGDNAEGFDFDAIRIFP